MTTQYLLAAALVAGYLMLTWYCLGFGRRRSMPAARTEAGSPDLLIAYASQGGQARQLAQRYAESLRPGAGVRLASLNQVDEAMIGKASLALFVVSTYGEGEPPDNALRFVRQWLRRERGEALTHLRFAILALGDSQYRQFCAFGSMLAAGLCRLGAQPLFGVVKVDGMNALHLSAWERQLAQHGLAAAEASLPARAAGAAFVPWRLQQRHCLNPGSSGGPVWLLRLLPPPQTNAHWQAGDIAEILPFNEHDSPGREYSIASIPEDGALELVVRQVCKADGSTGRGSGWLTRFAEPGGEILLRIRSNPSFHAPAPDRPMLLIGNGTGLAGLRAHLRSRELLGARRNCLFFGERNRAHDFLLGAEINGWQQSGHLQQLHLAFSRDQGERVYVQHRLAEQSVLLREWLDAGAVIYVCGSLEGMAAGVQQVLARILGEERLENMLASGDMRRDVY